LLVGKTIGFVPPVSIPAFVEMYEAMKTQAAGYGMTVVQAGGGSFDQTGQLQALNSMIARRVDVIVNPSLNPAAMQSVMERAMAAGIKWIDYDSAIAGPTLSIQSGETDSAREVALRVAARLKASAMPCAIGIVDGAPIVSALVHTAEGFRRGAEQAGCTILDIQTDLSNAQTGGQKIGNAWKARFGNRMTGVLVYVGSVTQGLLSTFDDSFHPVVGSEASSPAYRTEIASGAIAVGFDSNTAQVGQAAVYSAAQLLLGIKLPAVITSPALIVTSETIKDLPPPADATRNRLGISVHVQNGQPTFTFSYP
jgi:ABC-type sugar transport system substrate-binding protein